MAKIARLTDLFDGICTCHSTPIPMKGTIVTASENVKINGLGVARLTDVVLGQCGHTGKIVSASENMNANGLGIARVGDAVDGCLKGVIVTGSDDTIGNL